jgi:hypothetical protein
VKHHPVAASLAADIARRDPQRLSAMLTETVRLRALLPGGPLEALGRDNVASCLCALFDGFDGIEVVESVGEAVGDKLLIHYRVHVARAAIRWVCTQTAVCRIVDERLAVIDMLCSGFREFENNDDNKDVPASATAA